MSQEAFQAPSPEHLAELLPQYDIELFIAQGGMGAIYKGRQLSLDRDIAIKVLPHEMGESEEFRESFTTEAKAMAKLNHTNLLGVFDYGTVDGMPYIVMEYAEGGSLHQATYGQAVEPSQAVSIVKGICDGLAHAHEHGIIHRDIKPSNILLTTSIEPKVADFGLAQAADSDTPGLVMGTPGYTAPEVFQDPNQAGPLADIYSVGVILHQLLTGIDPAGKMEPPSQPTGNIRLDAIWRKATNPIPSQRYAGVSAMSADLEKWLAAKQKTTAVANPARRRPPQPAMAPSSSGGGMMGKLVAIAVLGALVFFAYKHLHDRKKEINDKLSEKGPEVIHVIERPADPEPTGSPTASPPQGEDIALPEPDPVDIADNDDPEHEPEDEEQADDEPEDNTPLTPGDPELRERAIGLIRDARKKRDKLLADNASALHFSLKSFVQGASDEELPVIERIKSDIVGSRVPSLDGSEDVSERISRAVEFAVSKEESIDQAYLTDVTRIRDAYVKRLEDAAEGASDNDLKKRLAAQAGEAADLDGWIQSLSPEDKPVRKSVFGGGGDFAGNWDSHSYGKVDRWIAHPDGRMEIVGQKLEVTWVILDDGTLEVRWPDKNPYVYRLEGDEWVGKTAHGGKAKLVRGNWD